MAVPKQKSDVRPISFVFHNTSDGSDPIEHKLVVRPEELTRSDSSRLTTHQTLGGAWADSFGMGLPTIQIAGTTGWGQGGLPNGQQEFQDLHQLIYADWHWARSELVANGKNPDLVKLIFNDLLDDFTWVVTPSQFVLKRSKSRPLLSQYQINLTYLSYDVAETMTALDNLKKSAKEKEQAALSSLEQTLKEIDDFVTGITSDIMAFLGPIKDGIMALVAITASVLNTVRSVIASGMRIVDAVTGSLMDIASGLSMAASNVFATVTSIQAIPGRIMARLVRVKTLFLNAFCIIKNTFKTRKTLPNYDDVYGASLCSSTAGGRPLSKYLDVNTLEKISPIINNKIAVTSDSVAAMMHLGAMDVALNPASLATVGSLSQTAASGVVLH